MTTARLETLLWVLIYIGMLAVGLGVVLARESIALGLTIAIAGGIVAAVGVGLIWVRARMKP
jgi:hypothetical protein